MIRIILCLLFLMIPSSAQSTNDSLYIKNSEYHRFVERMSVAGDDTCTIIFLGNSITAAGKWSTALERDDVCNHGIPSDHITGMISRLQYIYRLHPKICFLMAGINDLYADIPVETVFLRYTVIVDSLRSHNIIPVIQSTLLVNPRWKRAEVKNAEVILLNRFLSEYARKENILFVDIATALSAEGMLRAQYTTDGVHLTDEAYSVWRSLIQPVLRRYGL